MCIRDRFTPYISSVNEPYHATEPYFYSSSVASNLWTCKVNLSKLDYADIAGMAEELVRLRAARNLELRDFLTSQ